MILEMFGIRSPKKKLIITIAVGVISVIFMFWFANYVYWNKFNPQHIRLPLVETVTIIPPMAYTYIVFNGICDEIEKCLKTKNGD